MLGHAATAERWADVRPRRTSFDGLMPDGSPVDSWIALLEAIRCRGDIVQAARQRRRRHVERLSPRSPWRGPALLPRDGQPARGGSSDLPSTIAGRAVEVSLRRRDHFRRGGGHVESGRSSPSNARTGSTAEEGGRRGAHHRRGRAPPGLPQLHACVYAVAARTAIHRGDCSRAKEHVARASRLRPLCTAAAPVLGPIPAPARPRVPGARRPGAAPGPSCDRSATSSRPAPTSAPSCNRLTSSEQMLDTIRTRFGGCLVADRSGADGCSRSWPPTSPTKTSANDCTCPETPSSPKRCRSSASWGSPRASEAVAVAEQTGLLGR